MWLSRILQELGEKPNRTRVDNQSVLKLIKNPVFHQRTKHVDVKLCFVRDVYAKGEIEFEYMDSKNQLADSFTNHPFK